MTVACANGDHRWQVTSIAVPVQDQISLQPKLMVLFFRTCPLCKLTEDCGGRTTNFGTPKTPILS